MKGIIIPIGKTEIYYNHKSGRGLDEIYSQFAPRVKSLSCRVFVDGMSREDLEQELRVHIWEVTPKWNKAKSSYTTFIFNCLDNRIRTLIAKCSREKDIHLNTNTELPVRSVKRTFNLMEAERLLSEREFAIVIDRLHNGLTIEQMALKWFPKDYTEKARIKLQVILKKLAPLVE